jgi:8-oxo-dGTP diphosphatase
MNSLISPEFYNPNQTFMGCTGLILFGEGSDQALSFFRDGNTTNYPYHVDFSGGGRNEGESPFDTFRRETDEEFGIDIAEARIEHAMQYPSLLNSRVLGWFAVARVESSLASQIVFGNEGLEYQITSLDALYNHPLLIPRRRIQIENYLGINSFAA